MVVWVVARAFDNGCGMLDEVLATVSVCRVSLLILFKGACLIARVLGFGHNLHREFHSGLRDGIIVRRRYYMWDYD